MHRMSTVLALACLAACDPTLGGGPPVGGTDVVVEYVTAPCGSIAVTATEPSPDLDAPAVFEVGQIVGGRVDPEATANFRHYWDVDLEEGAYHLVVDSDVPDGWSTNTGMAIVQLDGAGVEIDTLIRGNEIDHRNRRHTVVVAGGPTTLRLEVSSVFGMEDYLIGVFEADAAVPSPYFDECPATTPLELGVPLDVALPAEDLEGVDEVWLTFDADIGDYDLTVDAAQQSGTSTNLQYVIDIVDRFGQHSRYEEVLRANEIDVSARLVGSFSVGEAASYWMRVVNGHEALDLTLTLE